MKEYYKYLKDVQNGKIKTSQYIKQQVERLESLKRRDDIYFDEDCVNNCFAFIRTMKHFAGKAAGKQFELLPWQKWVIGSVIGIKYKDSGLRVCRELFIMVARKNGKSSLIAALSLYMLVCDGEASPSIGVVASSKDQARILFEMIQQYSKTIDPKEKSIKPFRNYIKFFPNNGEVKVFASDSSKLDGLSMNFTVMDEGHSQKDNKLYSVMKSSMGFREQPLMCQITTAGFLTDGYPCFETYKVAIEILAGVKQQDEFFPFLYVMDPEDDWTDEKNWVKCNPCIDVTITREYLRDQKNAAKNDPSQEVPVKTKNFNMWCNSSEVWIPAEKIVKVMQDIDLKDFQGYMGYVGIDLASVSDLAALTIMIPKDDKFYFKSWGFVPRETFNNSINHELYVKFANDGDLIVTEGNICDYQYIVNKITELNDIVQIEGIYYDPYNSSQFAIQCTELGYNMQQFSQGLLNFSNPTKEFERLVLGQKAVIDKSSLFLWCMNNCHLKVDHNQNLKPDKATANNKIDLIISAVESLGGYLKNPINTDFELFVL